MRLIIILVNLISKLYFLVKVNLQHSFLSTTRWKQKPFSFGHISRYMPYINN